MFDLEESFRHWRQEIEATLAFSSEEIDELEDHLRFSIDAKLKEGLTLERAWARSQCELGSASALALEFAKDKLMPALWRLLMTWRRPGLLFFLFGLTFVLCIQQGWQQSTPGYNFKPWVSEPKLWGMAWVCLVATLRLLPHKTQKNAVLAGIGNSFCLIPILHVLFYNALTEQLIGTKWSHMAATFGWLTISLSLIGLVVLNVWWWKRSAGIENFPGFLALAGVLILVLTLSPFVGELIGNLSIREIYHMPTAFQLRFTGEVRSDFMKWKFVDVLINSVLFIANFLLFVLMLLICFGVIVIRVLAPKRAMQLASCDGTFPSLSCVPWMMALIGSCLCCLAGQWVEPNFSEQVREMKKNGSHGVINYGGLEIIVLLSAFAFFVCGYELTKRLARASRIRPFYAAMLVTFELVLALGLLPLLPAEGPVSSEPDWLSWVLALSVLLMAFCQIFLLIRKTRSQPGLISLWKFDGGNLVELGLNLGLVFACSGLILYMVAIVMDFESCTVIDAMISWGQSFKDPAVNHFYPQMYGTPDHLAFWVASGISYLSLCLAAGLGSVMVLSALEFIRFNTFRLYKIRKARQDLAENLVINE